MTLDEIQEKLEMILCDPKGKCCINGSDKDREIVQEALTELNTHIARLEGEGWQPISRLPVNERVILTFNYSDVYTGRLEADGIFYDGSWSVPDAEAWIPLPKAAIKTIKGE